MKCHWCDKELEKRITYDNGKKVVVRDYYECPEGHAEARISPDGKIQTFTFFFFIDHDGSKRYRMDKYLDGKVAISTRIVGKGGYRHMFTLDSGIELEIVEDVPQVEKLYKRLKKVAIFS